MSNKRARHELDQSAVPNDDGFVHDPDAGDSGQDDDDDEDKPKTDKKAGRRKIKIEFIQDKSRRHITFSKRKAGIMKKAYELSTLTGTQVLLLVVSETGLVYTFTTAKLQPLVTQPEGKNLIQACLNAPHGQLPSSLPVGTPINRTSMPMQHPPNVPGGLAIGSASSTKEDETQEESEDAPTSGDASGRGNPRKRRRASSSVNQPRGNTSPVVPGASGAPQAGAPSQSPHARPGQIPPGAPPITMAGVPAPMPLEHSPRQGGQAAPPPTSPNYAQPPGGYPPPPPSGDPNMYAHQQHGGYPGAPPPQPYGGFGHEGAPASAVSQNPWATPGVQHGGQYARR
ncbi:SRF-TF-domain-containing protein [Dichomitus squalens]|uniref:SRF-TF-domain-containing protein n=1 Tax=Dichomitus squalens (strain LYAD-421) TaxID=732165 RepID=UPI0004412741|nr:SRF-TF-domain-containing protein [Dichomitus squalens LYAD-421 SS1]EJF63547.1 SRF-TF-domain-containing protein [Dichomitus squalens LYAD-421 SS1]TBU47430.1 SRF-TF-domain-containing protein [Dichomitus squalens]